MSDHRVSLHRVFKTTPEKIFKAYADPIAWAWWLPPYGFLATVQQLEFKIDGNYRMTFINFSTGHAHSFGGKFLDIQPHKLIQYTNQFEDPNLPEVMVTTVRLEPVSCGTEAKFTQEGIPKFIPLEMCYLGWQESLEKLMKLTEPDIPDA